MQMAIFPCSLDRTVGRHLYVPFRQGSGGSGGGRPGGSAVSVTEAGAKLTSSSDDALVVPTEQKRVKNTASVNATRIFISELHGM